MTIVHIVLPNDIDDPATPSGGNTYDRRICDGLAATGWSVREHPVRGGWPEPAESERADLARLLGTLADGATVLVDGLIASAVPEVLVPEARRLRLAVLVHLPLGTAGEPAALSAARAVVATSAWCRGYLLDRYKLPADRVHVAPPGVDAAAEVPGTGAGTRLLCVAAVAPHKGHDVLVDALGALRGLPWTCACVGSLDRDVPFVERVRRQAAVYRIADRVIFAGARTGADLQAAYAAADLLVLPSHGETYGMVVTEALARGIPVLATAARGLPEALGHAPDGSLPGILVRPDDPAALAGALRRWLGDPDVRRQLRRSARARRTTLTDWSVTSARVAQALAGITTKVRAS